MEITKADVRRYRDDLLDCTAYLYEYLNNEASFWQFPCFDNIGDKAKQANDYIVITNDIETAKTLARIDRSLWQRIMGACDFFETDEGKRLFGQLACANKELFEIHNWYLEMVYNIPVKAVRNCEYYINTDTGEVRNSITQEVLKHPIVTQETAPQQRENPLMGNCEAEQAETSQKPLKPLIDKIATIFNDAVNKDLMRKAGEVYEWIGTSSLYGYFIEQISDKCNLKSSNGRIQWKYFNAYVINQNSILATAKQAINDYRNKGLNPPEGDDVVNGIINGL